MNSTRHDSDEGEEVGGGLEASGPATHREDGGAYCARGVARLLEEARSSAAPVKEASRSLVGSSSEHLPAVRRETRISKRPEGAATFVRERVDAVGGAIGMGQVVPTDAVVRAASALDPNKAPLSVGAADERTLDQPVAKGVRQVRTSDASGGLVVVLHATTANEQQHEEQSHPRIIATSAAPANPNARAVVGQPRRRDDA